MKSNQTAKPLTPEWEKEMMKLPKKKLVEKLKEVIKQNHQLHNNRLREFFQR